MEMLGTATYSPEDNKLRMYPDSRLSKEDYGRMKNAGFRWAPRQELFVTTWSPSREDLLTEFCGEIGDEDTSLCERAEERAERFSEYSDKRAADAESAKKAVSAIADYIPLGQPILVGHHSERRARKDAERIENGMRKACKMWSTSKYWTSRAAGALRHAKYKERPDVRARRIRSIEAEIRKYRAHFTPDGKPPIMQEPWCCPICKVYFCQDHPEAKEKVPHVWCAPRGGRGGSWVPVADLPDLKAYYSRWIEHCENRLLYERAMLDEQGGTIADAHPLDAGGAVKCWASPRGGWAKIVKVNKVSVSILRSFNGKDYFRATIPKDKLRAIMSKAEVDQAREQGRLRGEDEGTFFLADAPAPTPRPPQPDDAGKDAEFATLAESLKRGVEIAVAPTLFETPPTLVDQMVDLAEIQPGNRILEPSAGTGNIAAILRELFASYTARAEHKDDALPTLLCVELNQGLADRLKSFGYDVHCGDFLECNGDLGTFDRIIMNPPFNKGADIKHIDHAFDLLNPGGRLVAICANGPRQRAAFMERADYWEDLPDGTFKTAGTNVNTALLVLTKD